MHATDTQQVQPAADVDDVGGLAAKAAANLRDGGALVAFQTGPSGRDVCYAIGADILHVRIG